MKTLFKICPQPREKQCENKHFARANSLLHPKISDKGTYVEYVVYIHTCEHACYYVYALEYDVHVLMIFKIINGK